LAEAIAGMRQCDESGLTDGLSHAKHLAPLALRIPTVTRDGFPGRVKEFCMLQFNIGDNSHLGIHHILESSLHPSRPQLRPSLNRLQCGGDQHIEQRCCIAGRFDLLRGS